MRLLLVHDNTPEMLALQRRLGDRVEVQTAAGLREAIRDQASGPWRPDLVVIDPKNDSMRDPGLFASLGDSFGPAPVVLGAGKAEAMVEALAFATIVTMPTGSARQDRRLELGHMIDALVEQQRVLSRSMISQRTYLMSEMERAAAQAAERAVAEAMQGLPAKLGLDDLAGLQVAVRLAGTWTAARARFTASLTTGLAATLLLALGASIFAILNRADPR